MPPFPVRTVKSLIKIWSWLWNVINIVNSCQNYQIFYGSSKVSQLQLKGSIFVSNLLYISLYKHENRQVWWHLFQDHDVFVDLPVDGHCCGEVPCCVSTSPLQDGRHCKQISLLSWGIVHVAIVHCNVQQDGKHCWPINNHHIEHAAFLLSPVWYLKASLWKLGISNQPPVLLTIENLLHEK